ncbi:putative tpa: snare complex subunit vam7 protein [Neofusicoccum parvum UCRNP2]|uniref:Putative tpa: snare complex subunit vam7 protein n=1 Tax=Botryosphaeria parva (strain UCR-NP2) TaxID=1287680 RepID=R1E676_BOTPV|nr:putative tpa: snare complex subunit vam7 protein [Neofusicoccum parvum UCRNP2]
MLDGADRTTTGRPNSEPGSPVDAPDTHFGDYTPMGQGQKKTIYDTTARKGGFKDDDRDLGNWKEQSRRNITFGQHNAFPGLDDAIYEKKGDVEALLYLKQVRNEAAGLPTTVRGPEPNNPRGVYNTGLGDMRGYYSDGAYVAAPITAPAPIIGPVMPRGLDSTEEDELVDDEVVNDFVDSEGPVKWLDPQESYQSRLLLRFEGFCKLLAESPPKAAIDSLGRSKVYYFPTKPKAMGKAVRQWLKTFSEEPPHPVQMALMDGHCVLNLLDIVKRKLEAFKDVEENISLWIFALLARLTHVRPIHCDETSSIARELALRALMVRVTFSGEHISELSTKVPLYYNEDKEFFEDVGVDPKQSDKQQMKKESNKTEESVRPKESEALDTEGLKKMLAEKKELLVRQEALHRRVDEMPALLSKREAFGLPPREESDGEGDDDEKRENPYDIGTPCANTRTTIDMILSLACDVFGQKDLTKYKEIWGEYDYPKPSIEMELVFGEHGVTSRPSSSQELRPMLSPLSSPLRASFSPE